MTPSDLLDRGSLKELIAEWLEYAGDSRPVVGLEIEEALRRARRLLPQIGAGRLESSDVVLDEDFKDVLYGLVRLVQTNARGATAEQPKAVYEFIRGIEWPDDIFGEKAELLAQCLAALRPGPDENADPSATEARTLFEASLALIHANLIGRQALSEIEARGIEQDLLGWFVRFCRRSGGTVANVQALLLEASDKFALEKGRFSSAGSGTAPSAKLLELDRIRPTTRGRDKGAS